MESETAYPDMELLRVDEVGSVDEKIAVARNAVTQFPGEVTFKNFLALYLFWKWQEESHTPAIGREIELLCTAVMENSKDGLSIYSAIDTLNIFYVESGEPGKAYESDQGKYYSSVLTASEKMRGFRRFTKSARLRQNSISKTVRVP